MTGPADTGSGGAETGETAGADAIGETGTASAKRLRWTRSVISTVVIVLVGLLLAVLVRTFAFETFSIPSGSMEPTLGIGDRIVVQKAFFNWHDVHEGEIIVFTHPPLDNCPGPQNGDLVKRVIALPGQTIYSSGNNIYINGHLLAEPYLPPNDTLWPSIASRQHPYRVPQGEFYMLGDNRDDSCDSRYWGPIKGSTMIGQAVFQWWHDGDLDFHWF
jgi:signal peptidase I